MTQSSSANNTNPRFETENLTCYVEEVIQALNSAPNVVSEGSSKKLFSYLLVCLINEEECKLYHSGFR